MGNIRCNGRNIIGGGGAGSADRLKCVDPEGNASNVQAELDSKLEVIEITQAEYNNLSEEEKNKEVLYYITDGNGGGNFAGGGVVVLTQAEYDALPESKNTDGILYYIKDSGDLTASNIVCKDAEGNASTVQAELNKVNENLLWKKLGEISGLDTPISLPTEFNELYVECRKDISAVNNVTTINFVIPKCCLLDTYKDFTSGAKGTANEQSYLCMVRANKTDIMLHLFHVGNTAYSTTATMEVYYR